MTPSDFGWLFSGFCFGFALRAIIGIIRNMRLLKIINEILESIDNYKRKAEKLRSG